MGTNGSLCIAIPGMEMEAASVVNLVVAHPDRDPIEAADSGYLAILGLLRLQKKTSKCRN